MASDDDRGVPVRRYNDAEVRQLLERATRTSRPRAAPRPSQGMTLAQLEDIAAESHIDVARLRQAARELDLERTTQPATPLDHLAGAPLRIHVERTLPFEVDEKDLGLVASSISNASGDVGDSRLVGRTFTWTASTNSGRRTEVRVSVHRGTTNVRIDERYGELAGGLFGGVLGGVGGGAGIGGGAAVASALGSVALAVAIPATVIAGSYAACHFGFKAYVRRRVRHIDELSARIVQDLVHLRGADEP